MREKDRAKEDLEAKVRELVMEI
jgi:hypothetical protein